MDFRLLGGLLSGWCGGKVFAHLYQLAEEAVVLALEAAFEAGEMGGALAVGVEGGGGEGEKVFRCNRGEFQINSGRHAVHLEMQQGGLGGGDAEGAPHGVGRLENDSAFDLVLGLEAV